MKRRDDHLLPARGEKVGMRGPLGRAENRGNAPSPGLLRNPTSPRAAGRGEKSRRSFISLLGAAAATWPLAARAQQSNKLPTIGLLGADPATWTPWTTAFVTRLGQLGWIDGRTVTILYRWAEGRPDRNAEIAAEFVRLKVDVIVTAGSVVTTMKRATSTIPIVFAVADDPVGGGLVASLAQPGGNVTGLSIESNDLGLKRLELLRMVVPGLRRLAILFDSDYPSALRGAKDIEAATGPLGIEDVPLGIRRADDVARSFETLDGHADALYVVVDNLISANRAQIISLALNARLPTIFNTRDYAQAGGLMSYGPSFPDLFRRAAEMVDKILHGAKPRDIPVEEPTKFELVINLKTAKALGLTMPPDLLAIADEVIE